MNSNYEINYRICDNDGFKGTIRYIGPVAAAKSQDEIWLGIEWDDIGRGKHDGSCVDENGIIHRYFSCDKLLGSFIKPNKIAPSVSLSEALKQRYVEMDAPEIAGPDSKLPDAFVITSKGNKKGIELVGEMKIRKWQQINVVDKVVLRNERISSIGSDIQEIAQHFKSIDLQDNLIYKWSEIAFLCSQVPSLNSLFLHGNKFEPLNSLVYNNLPPLSFDNLKVLALNNCKLSSWNEVELLIELSPHLEELYLSGNNLYDLPSTDDSSDTIISSININGDKKKFENLKILDVSANNITNWNQIKYFENFINLEELVLDNNLIEHILNNKPTSFNKLFRLSISSNKIVDWKSIDALSTYLLLKQLRISNIPLFQGKGASEVRPKVIARIKQLEYFNGSGISPKERIDAEKNYLRSIQRDILDFQSETERINFLLNENPRYNELILLYQNDLIPLARVNDGLTLASEIITVTFHNLTFSSNGTLEPITKRIPSSITISRLKMMVKQMINLDIKLQQLSLLQSKDSLPVLLEDEHYTLQYYGAMDNAHIYINEKKPDEIN